MSQAEFDELKEEVSKLRRRLRKLEAKPPTPTPTSLPQPPVSVVPPALPLLPAAPSVEAAVPPEPELVQPSGDGAQAVPQRGTIYNGHTMDALIQSISYVDKLYDCIHTLLLMLFPVDYITSHSVSGQSGQKGVAPKAKFDERLYAAFLAALKSKFPGVTKVDITPKIHAVQKKYKTKASK